MDFHYSYGVEEAITPIDGRNRHKLISLTPYFSELALDRYRVLIELRYLQKLSEYKIIRNFKVSEIASINRLIEAFDKKDYQVIRRIEGRTNHDMKAVEEYVKSKLAKTSMKDLVEMVHFGLTSDDINNIAYSLMIRGTLQKVILPELEKIRQKLKNVANRYKNVAMLSLVYYKRLQVQVKILKSLKIRAKLTGNTGNLNAHKFIHPKVNWLKFSEEFISSFGLKPDLVTTQILPYDSYINVFSELLTINTILLGLCQDMWIYIMLGYFRQKVIKKEVGSTALPHKVNPIYFEGAEGGLGLTK